VREALFAALGDLEGARVIDLYAGSGALAIEALSRGAVDAVLVERSPAALRALRQNVEALGVAERVRVVARSVERAARMLGPDQRLGRELGLDERPFDLLLVDAPYEAVRDGSVARCVDGLLGAGACAAGATVVIEHAERDEPPRLRHARLLRTRRYGDTALSQYAAGDPSSALADD
jgi:16S rRNA (guanine966-N2)-methyltransferase